MCGMAYPVQHARLTSSTMRSAVYASPATRAAQTVKIRIHAGGVKMAWARIQTLDYARDAQLTNFWKAMYAAAAGKAEFGTVRNALNAQKAISSTREVEDAQNVRKDFTFPNKVKGVKDVPEIARTAMTTAIAGINKTAPLAPSTAKHNNNVWPVIVLPDSTFLKFLIVARVAVKTVINATIKEIACNVRIRFRTTELAVASSVAEVNTSNRRSNSAQTAEKTAFAAVMVNHAQNAINNRS